MQNTFLQYISVCNASGIDLHALGCFNLTIEESLFFYNQYPVDNLADNPVVADSSHDANVVVFVSFGLPLYSKTSNKLIIVRSNFSFSLGEQHNLGSGLSVYLDEHKYEVMIDNVVAYNNSGIGNINIACNATQYAITINNTRSLYGTSIQPNAFDTGGAGFYLGHKCSNAARANLFVYNSDSPTIVLVLVLECLLFGSLVQLVK